MTKIIPERLSSRFLDRAELSQEKLENAMNSVCETVRQDIKKFGNKFPGHNTNRLRYAVEDNFQGGWNTGFWSGILWLCYEMSHDEIFKETAQSHIPSFFERIEKKIGVNHHDMGFLYSPSCIGAYMITGNEQARCAAVKAAWHLAGRFREKGEFIQAWGNVDDEKDYRLIIDCLLNIPLLYRTTEMTGEKRLDEIAFKHYKTTMSCIFREDGSTYHTYYFDKKTGMPVRGVTHQGYSDESCWARGQAWGIYGIPLTSKYHFDVESTTAFEGAANYFLNRLPRDFVPYWDLIFTDSSGQPKDSSAAAIAVCGILEMQKYMKNEEMKRKYKNAADLIMCSLIDNYTAKNTDETDGILLHGTYYYQGDEGVDECNIWGDYFYTEALVRYIKKDWIPYW